MPEQYHYPPSKIYHPYSNVLTFFLLAFAGALYARYDDVINGKVWLPFELFFWAFFIFPIACLIYWMTNNLSVKIAVDDVGISYTSRAKCICAKWEDIVHVKRALLYERSRWQIADDLLIKTKDGSTIKIYGVVERCDGCDGGINEIAELLYSKTHISKDEDITLSSVNAWFFVMLLGIACFISGFLRLVYSSDYKNDLLSLLSEQIYFSADTLFIMTTGACIFAYSLYRLQRFK